ncbi:cation diffusion facilitator family transporter [bacterium]|nr:cation diffusion facilitator family transporter [bacterium]
MQTVLHPIHKPVQSLTSEQALKAARETRIAMRWSLAIGFLMLTMKVYAYAITQSAAILSDAAESVVHVLAVSFAAYSLWLSSVPADKSHPYGHDRISFFSAGFEGAMIVMAALYIIYEAVMKWIHGLYLENIEAGTFFVILATVINGVLGWYLVYQGKKHHSLILEANGKHVLTDSWTSFGVIVGLVLTWTTGWLPFDPMVAILVATNILWSGGKLMRRSIGGLMDESDPEVDRKLNKILADETAKYGIQFHDVRHRNAGTKWLIEFHLLFPKDIPISQAHEQATHIELAISKAFPVETEITSHLEPLEGHNEVHMKV